MDLTGINENLENQPNDDLFHEHENLKVADERSKTEVKKNIKK